MNFFGLNDCSVSRMESCKEMTEVAKRKKLGLPVFPVELLNKVFLWIDGHTLQRILDPLKDFIFEKTRALGLFSRYCYYISYQYDNIVYHIDHLSNLKLMLKYKYKLSNILKNVNFTCKMDEKFIREYADSFDKDDWKAICRTQNLSEPLMRDYLDMLDWYITPDPLYKRNRYYTGDQYDYYGIFQSQNLSATFVHDFKDRLVAYDKYDEYYIGDNIRRGQDICRIENRDYQDEYYWTEYDLEKYYYIGDYNDCNYNGEYRFNILRGFKLAFGILLGDSDMICGIDDWCDDWTCGICNPDLDL